jgi:hypothetical protein
VTDARVDARAGRVSAGAGAWPFAVDCRTGSATLELAEGDVVVRPLWWREKLRLARFSFLGVSFLDEQVLRLSLSEGAAPAEGDEREAALALALWLNDPGDGETLPLQAPLLASVTLEVCAAMGIAPAALDDREAVEVEALWRAVAERAAPQAHGVAAVPAAPRTPAVRAAPHGFGDTVEAGETTRIVFLPAPPPDPEPEGEAASPYAAHAPGPIPPAAAASTGEAPPGSTGARESVSDAGARTPPGGQTTLPAAAAAGAPELSAGPAEEREPRPHAPVSPARDAVSAAPDRKASTAPAAESIPPAAAEPRGRPSRARPAAGVSLSAPGATPPLTAALLRRAPSPRPRALPPAASQAAPVVRTPAPARASAEARPPAAVAHAPSVDADDVIDELSDRLSRAAAELGLEL